MARHTKKVTIPSDNPKNRDAGKLFILTEMPARKAEKWAARAFLLLTKANVEIPDFDRDRPPSIVDMTKMAFQALGGIPWEEAERLLDEMMECVTFVPTPSSPNVVRKPMEDDIEEATTLILLRGELLELHTGFTLTGLGLTSISAKKTGDSPSIQTSHD